MDKKYEINKLNKRLRANVGKAINDYNMIENNDVIMAAFCEAYAANPERCAVFITNTNKRKSCYIDNIKISIGKADLINLITSKDFNFGDIHWFNKEHGIIRLCFDEGINIKLIERYY